MPFSHRVRIIILHFAKKGQCIIVIILEPNIHEKRSGMILHFLRTFGSCLFNFKISSAFVRNKQLGHFTSFIFLLVMKTIKKVDLGPNITWVIYSLQKFVNNLSACLGSLSKNFGDMQLALSFKTCSAEGICFYESTGSTWISCSRSHRQ